jgi:ABC-type transport system substrate-binding protein
MMGSRGMGVISPSKMPKAKTIERKDDPNEVDVYKDGGKVKSRVNEAGVYTKPGMRKSLFEKIKAGGKGGNPGQWSARKAQMLAQQYKKSGGSYKS